MRAKIRVKVRPTSRFSLALVIFVTQKCVHLLILRSSLSQNFVQ